MYRAPADGTDTRVQHAAGPVGVVGGHVLGVLLLPIRIRVVPNPVVPLDRRVFRDRGCEQRHVRRERVIVAAGLEEHDFVPRQCQPAREGPASRARAHDDVLDWRARGKRDILLAEQPTGPDRDVGEQEAHARPDEPSARPTGAAGLRAGRVHGLGLRPRGARGA